MTERTTSLARCCVITLACALLADVGGVSCTAPRQPGSPTADESLRERVERLGREARALARADGCQAAGDCRVAPFGDLPCGGHYTYLVYCVRTTDSAALYRKLAEHARAERAYNETQGMGSICGVRAPPPVTVSGGSCRAAEP